MTPVFTSHFSAFKRFVVFSLVLLLAMPSLGAQDTTLFAAPDTVCVKQKIQLTTTEKATSYYWTFCSGALSVSPGFTNFPNTFGANGPLAIEADKDDNGRYYAFLLNQNDTSLIRLDFGTSLSNTPVYTILSAYNAITMPDSGRGLHLMRDTITRNWYLFVTGATTTSASIARLSFGTSLGNTPTCVNLGNPGNVLSNPRDLYVQQEGKNFYGVILNSGNSSVVRASFGNNIRAVPTLQNLGNIGNLDVPQNLTVSNINGIYRVYVTNTGTAATYFTTLNFGRSLSNTPTGTNSADLFGSLFTPTGLAYYRDCDYPYLVIANGAVNTAVRVQLDTNGDVTSDPTAVTDLLGGVNFFSAPYGMTKFLRDSGNLYVFVADTRSGNLTRINFSECTRSSIGESTSQTPAPFSYDTTGTFTVNLILNEGQPDMRMSCQLIKVLPQPGATISNDTLICQGDTITLRAQSVAATSVRWMPATTLDDTTKQVVRAFPSSTTGYRAVLTYENGCNIDTVITVRVREIVVDAGPDRTLVDGTTTVLGGPETSQGVEYSYRWSPSNYLDDSTKQFPVAQPFTNYTYYLTVTTPLDLQNPGRECPRTDSVVVRVVCNNITLPNAFAPSSDINGVNRFGILNRQLVRLLSFKIFNRWGQQVYSSADLTGGWDGMFNGKEAETGVYVWEVDGFCPDGQRIKQKGDVTLLR